MNFIRKTITVLLFLFLHSSIIAQSSENLPPIIFIYDASGSMWGQIDGTTKMDIASDVLSKSIIETPKNQPVGVVAYGHRKKGDCRDVETLISSDNKSKDKVIETIKSITPLGKTPLAYAAELVINGLKKSNEKATIILLTDGIESCDGNICNVVSNAKKEGINFKLHIVGFGLKENETSQLKCASKAGNGNYYNAENGLVLGEAMQQVMNQTIDKKVGNHGVYASMNGEGIDALVVAYQKGTTKKIANGRTYRDTSFLYLPKGVYDIKVTPLEGTKVKPITVSEIETFESKKSFQNVSFDSGSLSIRTTNNKEDWDCTLKIYDKDGKLITGTRTYGRTKDVVIQPGTYTIKIQALNMKGFSTNTELINQTVTAGNTTKVGHDFSTGTVEILTEYRGEYIDCVAKFVDTKTGKNVVSGRTYTKGLRYHINPGTYQIKATALGTHKTLGSNTITITVKEGENISQTIKF